MSQIVLLAEDESIVRKFVVASLERENFIVLATCTGAEALEVSRNQASVNLLLTDVQLGEGINGIELAERIMEEKPGTKVLVISGFPDKEIEAADKRLPFLGKPFTPAVLVKRVRELLSKIPAQAERKSTKRITG